MKRIVYLLSLLIAVFTFKSCSTDFDVIGEYEETAIVYCMLDQSESLHFIKINKSFLGPGSAFDYAAIRDSSEYENVNGKVEEWKNGVLQRDWVLMDTVLTDREDGAFYGPEQTVYYFNEPLLDTGAEYRLVININEGQTNEKEVTSSTELIRSFTISQPSSSPSAQVSFLSTYPPVNNASYNDFNIKWRNGTYGKRYDLTIRFKYDEVTASGTERKYIDWFLGSEYVADEYLNRGGLVEFVKVANGFAFYSFIAAKIQDDPNVLKRVFRSVDIMVTAASEELNTYMIVNSPSNGLIQEKPQFTNISNGIGLFSARYNVKRANKFLSKNSLQELCQGTVTGHLNFCSDSTAWALEPFYCP